MAYVPMYRLVFVVDEKWLLSYSTLHVGGTVFGAFDWKADRGVDRQMAVW